MDNWKDYLRERFPDKDFSVDKKDDKNNVIESYSIKSKNTSSQTEIVFEIFKSDTYKELYNVQFFNPNSPILNESNDKDNYGFDGQESTFNKENIAHLEDWLLIPITHGWTERTTYYSDKPVKTELIWFQRGKMTEIPLKQNYLEKFGCLTFPIIPVVIWWTNWKLKHWTEKIKVNEKIIGPMI